MPRIVKSSMNFKPAFKPKPRPVPKSTPAVATPDTSTPNSPAIATAVETAEGSVLGVPAVQDHRDEIPQENANRETDQAGNVSTENPPPESSSQQPTTQEAPLNQAQPISPPFTAPSILTQPHLHFPSQSTPGPSSPSSPSQSDPKHVVPIIPGISANDFPHRMTEAQLRPTSGFVLPDVQDVGGGTGRKPVRRVDSAGKEKADDEEEGSQGEEEDVEAKNNKKSKDKGKGKGKGKGKAKVVRASTDEPEQATGEKRKRSTRNPKPIIDPSLEQDLDSQSGSGSSDSEDYSTGYHSRSPSPSQNTSGGKPSKGSKRKRNPKRMRVDMKDDLTPIQLEYLQPGEAIGEPIDEARMTMADLASVPGEGRISGKAIRIQQGREEILRRKEEEVGKRVRWRVEREMKMRGPAGVEPDERGGMDGPDQGQGQGDEDGEGEEDEDEGLDEEDKDDEGSERPTALKPMRTDEYGNILEDDEDVEILPTLGEGGKTVDPLAAESDDDEEDTYEYTNNRTGIQMSLDADGNMVINNTIDRAQLLRDRMDEGEAIEENDDLKFTNMMSHSKRAATIRWSKDMKSKLMLLLRQHGQVYETIAKIMSLTWPMIERTHVANHLRAMGNREPELLSWALARENKLDIDMAELKVVYPGIDFDAELPDITMYYNPNIDASDIRAMRTAQKKKTQDRPLTEQERKKQARKEALAKKRREKARAMEAMGTVEEEVDMDENYLAAVHAAAAQQRR